MLVVFSVFFWERRGIDDPVGAISVHGVNGLWGVISVGIFANGKYGAGWNGVVRDEFVKQYGSDGVRGILYGDASQLAMQAIDCVVLSVFGFVMAYAWFKLSNLITPIRVSRETEIAGLDGPRWAPWAIRILFLPRRRWTAPLSDRSRERRESGPRVRLPVVTATNRSARVSERQRGLQCGKQFGKSTGGRSCESRRRSVSSYSRKP